MKKRVTIYDLAEITGFSVGTVNRALNGKPRISPATKQQILDAAAQIGYKVNPAAQGLRRNTIRLGAVLFCPVKEYSDAILKGIASSAEDLEKYNVAVDIAYIPYQTSADCCRIAADKLRFYCANHYDGVVLFASSGVPESDELTALISTLKENGIAVATLANDLETERDFYVGVDAYTAGKLAAELLALCCGKSDVAILTNSEDSPIHATYLKGFFDYAGTDRFTRVQVYSHFDIPARVISETDRLIQENPTLKGIYMTSASSTIACKRIAELGKTDLRIITTDILTDTPTFLQSGIATATIFQNPYRQGRDAIKLLYAQVTREPVTGHHLIPPIPVFKANLADYMDTDIP